MSKPVLAGFLALTVSLGCASVAWSAAGDHDGSALPASVTPSPSVTPQETAPVLDLGSAIETVAAVTLDAVPAGTEFTVGRAQGVPGAIEAHIGGDLDAVQARAIESAIARVDVGFPVIVTFVPDLDIMWADATAPAN